MWLIKDQRVNIWADCVYSSLRDEQVEVCALVVIGANERGERREVISSY